MAETPTDVLVAGHPDIDGATKDFGSLGELVRDTQVSIDGVIVVTRAPDGSAGAADVPQPRPRGWGGAAGPGSRLASSCRCCWRRSPWGLSRAWSLVSSLVIASSGTSAAILILKGERCEPESSRH